MVHSGGCHCRKVRWKVEAPASVVGWKCNCSNCSMRGNTHFVVPAEKFELLGDSKEFLTTYTFGTHSAKHTFCKICGITSFYIPRSNQDGVAVTLTCVDPGTLAHVEIKSFDGKNWESSYSESGIASYSKVQNEDWMKKCSKVRTGKAPIANGALLYAWFYFNNLMFLLDDMTVVTKFKIQMHSTHKFYFIISSSYSWKAVKHFSDHPKYS